MTLRREQRQVPRSPGLTRAAAGAWLPPRPDAGSAQLLGTAQRRVRRCRSNDPGVYTGGRQTGEAKTIPETRLSQL